MESWSAHVQTFHCTAGGFKENCPDPMRHIHVFLLKLHAFPHVIVLNPNDNFGLNILIK